MQNLIPLILAALPLILVHFSVFGARTNVFEVVLLGGCLAAAPGIFSLFRAGATLIPPSRLFRWGAALFLAGGALAALVTPTHASLGALKGWFGEPAALFLLVRYGMIRDIRTARRTLLALAASGMLVAIVALGYWVRGALTYDGRLAAFYESPNQLAMVLAYALVALYAAYPGARAERVFRAAAAMPIVGALVLTRSAGAFVGLTVSAICCAVLYALRRDARAALAALLVVGGLALPIVATRYGDALHGWFSVPERSSLSSRVMVWKAALDIGRDHPIVGIGPGNFQDAYLAYQPRYAPYLEWAVPQPHNTLLALWVECGLLGLSGFLLLCAWCVRAAPQTGVARFGLFTLLAYLLVHGMVDTLYFRGDLAHLFWVVLALFAAESAPQGDANAAVTGDARVPSSGYANPTEA